MFNHVGKKIKGIAKIIFWIGFILGILTGISAIFAGIFLMGEVNEGIGILVIIAGILYIGLSFLISWVSVVLLYGYGELIDQTMLIRQAVSPDHTAGYYTPSPKQYNQQQYTPYQSNQQSQQYTPYQQSQTYSQNQNGGETEILR